MKMKYQNSGNMVLSRSLSLSLPTYVGDFSLPLPSSLILVPSISKKHTPLSHVKNTFFALLVIFIPPT